MPRETHDRQPRPRNQPPCAHRGRTRRGRRRPHRAVRHRGGGGGGGCTPPPPPPPVSTGPIATSQIAALSYTNQQGIGGYNGAVAWFDSGDWIEYAGVNFQSGVKQFNIALGLPSGYHGRQIHIHVDGVNGPLIGTLTAATRTSTSATDDRHVSSSSHEEKTKDAIVYYNRVFMSPRLLALHVAGFHGNQLPSAYALC